MNFYQDYTPDEDYAAEQESSTPEKPCSGFRTLLVGFLRIFALVVVVGLCLAICTWRSLVSSSVGDHGATLDEYIENVRDLDYATMALFDTCGIKYYETTVYDHGHVSYLSDTILDMRFAALGSFIHVHNHPIDVPFSVTDLTNEHYDGGREMVVSSEHVYILEAPNGWPTQEEVADYFATIYAEESFFEVIATEQDNGIATTDALLEDFSGKFGLVYVVMTIDEWKTR